jgi:hypothetical protein
MIKQNMLRILFCSMVVIFIGVKHIYAYDDTITHPALTIKATYLSILDAYVKQNFGTQFPDGIRSFVNGKAIADVLAQGSKDEDHPMCQASNHFHNPLLPWNASQMSDDTTPLAYAIRTYCDNAIPSYPYIYRKSNVTWATGYLSPSPDGNKYMFLSSESPKPINWDTARASYYSALTDKDAASRDADFAATFSALGHVLHLIEDMAVPAHVRNDFQSHLEVTNPNAPLIDQYNNPFEWYVKNHTDLVTGATVTPTFANVHLTDFWDTDQYNGSNPSTFTDIGLAEFTNANYFSTYTIPNNGATLEHTFPYPHISGTNISGPNYQICSYKLLGGVASVYYVSRMNKGPCPSMPRSADHFAVASLMNVPGASDINSISHVWLNDEVHEQYAQELLPRAVGYSAGLLNYFCRGALQVLAPDRCLYGLTDGSGNLQRFNKLKVKVGNVTYVDKQNTIVEAMQSGILQAVAKYKVRSDYMPDMSNDPPTPPQVDPGFSYSVSSAVTLNQADIDALNNAYKDFTFDFTSSPIPAGITDLYLQVVFKGTLGNETDNAIAVGFKDLSEPTHINSWNTTDYVYSAGKLRPSTNSENVTINEQIAFCPSHWPVQDVSEYNAQYAAMGPGQFGRIIFISDPGIEVFYGVTDTSVSNPSLSVVNDWYLPWTTIYQTGTVGVNTHVYEFRGKSFNEASGYYNASVTDPDDGFWLADWPAAANDAIPATNINW